MAQGPLPEGFLETYKLAVEMADRVSARRAVANTFLLAVQSTLVALVGSDSFDHRALAGAGLLLAGTWWLILRSYRDLNGAKFAVICEMEKQLPARPFTDEWEKLKKDPIKKWRGRYAELGVVERFVPAIFAVINIIVLAHP